jgi:hypothetical protein
MKVHTSIMKVHSTLAQISEEDTSEDSGASGEEMDYNYNSEDYSSALAHMYKVADSSASGEMKKRSYHKAECAADAYLFVRAKRLRRKNQKWLRRDQKEALERCEYVAKRVRVRSIAWKTLKCRIMQNNYSSSK